MLKLGDFDMNAMPRDSSSLKDVFRKTMLHQETIFRNQVHELHRLYSVQKTLMKDLKSVELEKRNPLKAKAHSFSRETRLATNPIPMLDSRASTSRGLFEGWQGNNYKFQPMLFGQSLLPNQHISLEDNNIPNKVKIRDNLNEAMDVNSLHGRNSSDPPRLSLSLGVVNGKTEDKERNMYDKKTSSCSRVVIDLEKSPERTSDEDTKNLPFGGKLDSQVTINSDGLKHKEKMPDENFLTKNRQFTLFGVGCVVDLNEVPLITSDNNAGISEVQVISSVSSGRNECELSRISPASESRPEIELSKDLKDEPTLNPTCVVATQLGCEKTEEGDNALCSDKIGITIQDEHPDMFPSSGKSSCISDNDSSPVRTTESGTQPFSSSVPASDQFSETQGTSKVAETSSGEQDRRSSDSNETKDDKEESPEVNDLIQIAAESLILISKTNPVPHQESSTLTAVSELENEDKDKDKEQSYDSFELMTLKLTESAVDDNSVSSKPFEVSDEATNGFAMKLRRGRRMKDFQKDILPSLASLSRQEIREDVNVLEGVLRSREYKKMRAMTSNEEGWCKPVRSKRSRRKYSGKKKT